MKKNKLLSHCALITCFIIPSSIHAQPDNDNISETDPDSESFPQSESMEPNETGSSDSAILGYQDPREDPSNDKVAFVTPFGQLNWSEIRNSVFVGQDDRLYLNYKGYKLKLTLDRNLQESVQKDLSNQKNISAATVILESKSGRILAMGERKSNIKSPLSNEDSILTSARAPAASLMKIVTATAAIEKRQMEPDDEILFRGGCSHLRRQNWLRDKNTDKQKLSLAMAFGNSCNTVFARIALYTNGLSVLKEYAEKYLFNRPISSDIKIETSAVLYPSPENATTLEVAEAGAGFGSSKISPVHSALLSAAIGNNGAMMAPHLVDEAYNAKGILVYKAKAKIISNVFTQTTAEKLGTCMKQTILTGTSRKYFKRKGTSRDRFDIGGKTGTLSDAEDRTTLYTWFSGIAPLDSPDNIAIGTLVASPKSWIVRASAVAQTALSQFLRLTRLRHND